MLRASHRADNGVRLVAAQGLDTWVRNNSDTPLDQEPLKSLLARLQVMAASDPDRDVRANAEWTLEFVNKKK